MSIETNSASEVIKDGEVVGNIVNGEFVPVEGLHHKTVKAVAAYLENIGDTKEKPEKTAKAKGEPQPPHNPEMGDLDPDFIEWHRKNKTKEEHEARYGKDERRLTHGGHVFPEGQQ